MELLNVFLKIIWKQKHLSQIHLAFLATFPSSFHSKLPSRQGLFSPLLLIFKFTKSTEFPNCYWHSTELGRNVRFISFLKSCFSLNMENWLTQLIPAHFIRLHPTFYPHSDWSVHRVLSRFLLVLRVQASHGHSHSSWSSELIGCDATEHVQMMRVRFHPCTRSVLASCLLSSWPM